MTAYKYSQTITLKNGKPFLLQWTERAQQKLQQRDRPLIIELELYFSCLVKKFVHFHEQSVVAEQELTPVTEQLTVWFHPVHSVGCAIDEAPNRQPHQDVDKKNLVAVFPKRAVLDVKQDGWIGEYFFTA